MTWPDASADTNDSTHAVSSAYSRLGVQNLEEINNKQRKFFHIKTYSHWLEKQRKFFHIKTYSHKEPSKITKQSPSWITFPKDIDNQEFPHCMILNKMYQHICRHYPVCWILLSGIFFLTCDTCYWLKPLSTHSDYSIWLSEICSAFFYKILLIQRSYLVVYWIFSIHGLILKLLLCYNDKFFFLPPMVVNRQAAYCI